MSDFEISGPHEALSAPSFQDLRAELLLKLKGHTDHKMLVHLACAVWDCQPEQVRIQEWP